MINAESKMDSQLINDLIDLAIYNFLIHKERHRIKEIKKQEELVLDSDLDYYNKRLNLSDEVLELLQQYRPSNVCSNSIIF